MNNLHANLPADFLENMQKILTKSDYELFLKSFQEKSEKGINVNTNKITVNKFLELYKKENNLEVSKIPYYDKGFYVKAEKVGGLLHQIGAFYSQEPSSMVPVACVEHLNLKGKRVLDLCSAPGGKSIQMAELIGNDGLIVCNEIITNRSKILFSNIERLGLCNTIVLNENPKNLSEFFEGYFDVVIVDAPCSGEGMFRKEESAIRDWNKQNVIACAERQKNILDCAFKCLKKDGILIYSTCTYNTLENEENVNYILNNNFKQLDINEKVKPYVKYGYLKEKTVRCFPFFTKGEGQFCSVFQNKNENFESTKPYKKINFEKNVLANDFLSKYFEFPYEIKLETVNGKINILPKNCCNTTGLKVVSKGVILGEIVKNRIEPHHQLFSSYGNNCKIKLNCYINDETIKKYIKGEQLSYNLENGFGCVVYENIPIGGFKSVNGSVKNYYPKGLRTVIK